MSTRQAMLNACPEHAAKQTAGSCPVPDPSRSLSFVVSSFLVSEDDYRALTDDFVGRASACNNQETATV